jgi:hypothetical protein
LTSWRAGKAEEKLTKEIGYLSFKNGIAPWKRKEHLESRLRDYLWPFNLIKLLTHDAYIYLCKPGVGDPVDLARGFLSGTNPGG